MFEAAKKFYGDKKVSGIEVGTSGGDNALTILKEWTNIQELICVDSYPTYSDFIDPRDQITLRNCAMRNFAYQPKVNLIIEDANKAAVQVKDKSVDFVYIDANHSYTFVKDDINYWLPKVKAGGMIGGHDYDWTDKEHSDELAVKKAVDERFGDRVQYGIFVYDFDEHALTARIDSDWWVFV